MRWHHPTQHQVRDSFWNLPGASGTPRLLKDPVWPPFLNRGKACPGPQNVTGLGHRGRAPLKEPSWLEQGAASQNGRGEGGWG